MDGRLGPHSEVAPLLTDWRKRASEQMLMLQNYISLDAVQIAYLGFVYISTIVHAPVYTKALGNSAIMAVISGTASPIELAVYYVDLHETH